MDFTYLQTLPVNDDDDGHDNEDHADEHGGDDEGDEIVACLNQGLFPDCVGGQVVEGAVGVGGVGGEGGGPGGGPEVGVDVPVDALLDKVLMDSAPCNP